MLNKMEYQLKRNCNEAVNGVVENFVFVGGRQGKNGLMKSLI
jgi:hypothetical protein